MKRILWLIFFSQVVFAQHSGYVNYDYRVTDAVEDYTTKSVLNFNHKGSLFQTFRNDKHDDTPSKRSIGENGETNIRIYKDSENKPAYFIDKKNNLLITKVRKFEQLYLLTEQIPVIKWDLKQEYKEVSGLNCQKAIGSFRGRNYIAWFTDDIPVNLGPWKLNGLPGLILEAEDNQGIFSYRATKIKLDEDEAIKIDIPDIRDAVTLKKFITEIIPEKREERDSKFQAKLDRSIVIESVTVDRSGEKEKEYEWETDN